MDTDRTSLRAALFPAALRAVERGEFPAAHNQHGREHVARIVANYATTDLLLTGRTLLLPAPEVEEVVAAFWRPAGVGRVA